MFEVASVLYIYIERVSAFVLDVRLTSPDPSHDSVHNNSALDHSFVIHFMLHMLHILYILYIRRQEDAPTDITGLFNSIYDRINENLDDVVSVQITYVGDVIHR